MFKLTPFLVRNFRFSCAFKTSSRTITKHTLPYSCLPLPRPNQLLTNVSFYRHSLCTSAVSCVRNQEHNYQSGKQLPCLMNNPTEIVWPSFIKSLRNLISSVVIIKPYFDHEFGLKEFSRGAKHALSVVANAISVGDIDSLEDLVEKKAFDEIKLNLSKYSHEQLADFAIKNPEDVYLTFPYQVGIIMNDNEKGVQERFVEITVCFHILQGLGELMKNDDFKPGPGSFQQYRDRIVICNYRFIREFTKGVQDYWKINMIHHFRLLDDDH